MTCALCQFYYDCRKDAICESVEFSCVSKYIEDENGRTRT